MKKTIAIVFSICALLLFLRPVEAHFLVTDNNIGAVLHVDPNDEPIANSPASFYFDFKDKENKFKPQDCICTFSIQENDKEIYSQPLFQNSATADLTTVSVVYTFPQQDVYHISVTGKPVTSGEFQSFTLGWDFRVDQQAANNTMSLQPLLNFVTSPVVLAIIILIVLSFIIYDIWVYIKKKRGE